MAEKPKRKGKTPDQSRRFKEAARELGLEESGEAFERAFEKIVPPKRPPSNPDQEER